MSANARAANDGSLPAGKTRPSLRPTDGSRSGRTAKAALAETLDRIPGVAGARFHGAMDEISLRGLGPFLGYSTFNGRQLTNGSGDRAAGFQMFPSELMSSVLVYKTSQAPIAMA